MNKQFCQLYYFGLGIFALFMIANTIFVSSNNVHFGKEIAGLEKAKIEAKKKSSELSAQLTAEQSINQIALIAQGAGYQPVGQVLSVVQTQAVASR